MSQELINRSADLKKLRDEGLNIEVKTGLLLVRDIPYLNAQGSIEQGILISELDLTGDATIKPKNHVIHFSGEYPCTKDGTPIKGIKHKSEKKTLADGIEADHSFSNKPKGGYKDYYEKVTTYIKIISAPAKSLDSSVTEKTFQVIEDRDDESVFNYIDSNSSRAAIVNIMAKLEHQKIAIIGLGGTGAYVFDLISKTPVQEIHLFDGDKFLQHNAFRSPGAASVDILKAQKNKTHYFRDVYSVMRRNIFAYDQYISADNIDNLANMDFVFICIDESDVKKLIITQLEDYGTAFIDVGMGILEIDEALLGQVRVTTSTKDMRKHLGNRISFSNSVKDEYSTNIQIAELNALNASLAVIKWKKLLGFYQDRTKEHNSIYVIDTGQLTHDDEEESEDEA